MSKESFSKLAAVKTLADQVEKLPVGEASEIALEPEEGVYDHLANEKAEAQVEAWLKDLAPEKHKNFLEEKLIDVTQVIEGTNIPVDNANRYLAKAIVIRLQASQGLNDFYNSYRRN